jgi:transitional endoplasmic reticulum ATPase
VPEPNEQGRTQIFKIYTKDMPITKDISMTQLAILAKNYSGADISALCREAAMYALRKDVNTKEIKMTDFEEAKKRIGPSITPDMEKWYKSFMQQARQAQKPATPVA